MRTETTKPTQANIIVASSDCIQTPRNVLDYFMAQTAEM